MNKDIPLEITYTKPTRLLRLKTWLLNKLLSPYIRFSAGEDIYD